MIGGGNGTEPKQGQSEHSNAPRYTHAHTLTHAHSQTASAQNRQNTHGGGGGLSGGGKMGLKFGRSTRKRDTQGAQVNLEEERHVYL